MIHRRHGAMRFEKLLWITKAPPKRVGLYLINITLPRESGIDACISSRITTGIQVVRDYQINYNWYNEPFAVFKVKELYLDMHGLIFETSVWLLAESTRLLSRTHGFRAFYGKIHTTERSANLSPPNILSKSCSFKSPGTIGMSCYTPPRLAILLLHISDRLVSGYRRATRTIAWGFS